MNREFINSNKRKIKLLYIEKIKRYMMKYFYYLETDDENKLFKYLDECVDEGYIGYDIDEPNGMVIIENFLLDDDDDVFIKLVKKYDLIEDFDCLDNLDDDYDDFYNPDDYET